MATPRSKDRRSAAEDAAGRDPRRVVLAGALLVVLLGIVAFERVRVAGFVQDDVPIVQDNPLVREGSLARIFATDWWAGVGGQDDSLYRPVTLASFALERGPAGVEPARSHLLNLAIHLAVSLLVLALALRLGAGARVASASAILFAVHPVHTAAVAGLVGRAELLAGAFVVGAVWAYTAAGAWGSAIEFSAMRARAAAWAAAACVFLAAGSKETGLVALPLLAAVDLVFRRPERGAVRGWLVERGAAIAPAVLAVTVYLVLRVRALGAFPGFQRVNAYENPIVALDGTERIATILAVAARYARLLLWPTSLSADYSGNAVAAERSLFGPLPLMGMAVLAAAALIALSAWIGRGDGPLRRGAALGAWIGLGSYLLVGNIVVPSGQVLAERFLYVPSIGFVLVAAFGIAWLVRRAGERPSGSARLAKLATVALAAAAIAGVAATRTTVRDWTSDESLYTAARRNVPSAPRASATLAKIRLTQGRVDEATALIDETLRLWPEQSGALVDRGLILVQRGRFEVAADAFRSACRVNPYNETAAVSLGLALARLDRLEDAERSLRSALRRFPRQATAWAELGNVLDRLGRTGEAIQAWQTGEKLGRSDLRSRIVDRQGRL